MTIAIGASTARSAIVRRVPVRAAIVLGVALIAGFGADAAFPDRNWWPLAMVSMAALWLCLQVSVVSRRPLRSAGVGFAWGIGFFFPQLFWADDSVGVVPWVAISVASALFPALFAASYALTRHVGFLRKSRWYDVAVVPILWVAMELLRCVIPFGGFPWGRLAFSQSTSPLARLAVLGGMPLISGTVVGIGVILGIAVVRLRTARWQALVIGALAVVVTAAPALIPLDSGAEDGTIQVAAIQGNLPNAGLNAFEHKRQVLNNHVAATDKLAATGAQPDIVVWPENATDIDPMVDASAADEINGAADSIGAPIVLGTMVEGQNSDGKQWRQNVSIVWVPDQGVVDSYAKQHPAPFAEYIPMRSFARIFSDKVDLVPVDMTPGTGPAVVSVPVTSLHRDVTSGDLICFEVAYDDLARQSITHGAEFLMVQTNNASFGRTAESVQQLAMSRLRAIEHGRSVVHASTVGVSAIYDPAGRELARSGHFTQDELTATIPLRTSETVADRFGFLLPYVCAVLALGLIACGVVGAIIQRRRRTYAAADAHCHADVQREREPGRDGGTDPLGDTVRGHPHRRRRQPGWHWGHRRRPGGGG